MRRPFFLTLLATTFSVNPVVAQNANWSIDPKHSSAQFSIKHMMVSNVKGQFSNINGSVSYDSNHPENAKVDATIDTNTIDTREPQRDTHLKGSDFFDVKKFPTMAFHSKKIDIDTDGKLKMTGNLIMHGVTKEVALDLEKPSPEIKDMHGSTRIGATATTKLNRKDFGINWSGMLDNGGAVVGDEVIITLDVEMLKKSPTSANTTVKSPSKVN